MVLGGLRVHKASDVEGTANTCFLATILALSTFIITNTLSETLTFLVYWFTRLHWSSRALLY